MMEVVGELVMLLGEREGVEHSPCLVKILLNDWGFLAPRIWYLVQLWWLMLQAKRELVVVREVKGCSPFDLLVMLYGSFLGGEGFWDHCISP